MPENTGKGLQSQRDHFGKMERLDWQQFQAFFIFWFKQGLNKCF